jgi:hypothetical protein
MRRFATREEYEAWKAAKAAGSTPPLPGASAAAAPPPARKGLLSAFEGMPGWAWPFVLACVAIPVVTLGGAIPAALGFGSASLCAGMSRRDGSIALRVAVCAAIALGAWGVLAGVIHAFR